MFQKKLNKKSETCSQLSDKENHNKSVSNPSKASILNDTDFENEIFFKSEYFVNVDIRRKSRSLMKY